MPDPSPAGTLLFLREEELRQGLELLYFAHRDLAAEAERILDEQGLAPVHHLILQFVARQPQVTVGELIAILRLTKQSLSRALAPLLERGLVTQRPGQRDRRQRELVLTEAGIALERRLWEPQRLHLARAYRDCGPQAVEAFRRLLLLLIGSPADRRRFERRPPGPAR